MLRLMPLPDALPCPAGITAVIIYHAGRAEFGKPARRDRSVLPARANCDVVLGTARDGVRAVRGRPSLGDAARQVDEPIEPVFGLDVAIEQVDARRGQLRACAGRARKILL